MSQEQNSPVIDEIPSNQAEIPEVQSKTVEFGGVNIEKDSLRTGFFTWGYKGSSTKSPEPTSRFLEVLRADLSDDYLAIETFKDAIVAKEEQGYELKEAEGRWFAEKTLTPTDELPKLLTRDEVMAHLTSEQDLSPTAINTIMARYDKAAEAAGFEFDPLKPETKIEAE
jgi:hypothetical protein